MAPKLMKLIAKASVFLGLMALCVNSRAADGSSLKPPAGARVAIVVFEDLECPSCANAYPKIWDAAHAHSIPVLLRDFPLGPKHPWSLKAAVWARFFDTQSEKMGIEFRGYIFGNQNSINPSNLRQYVQKFADTNHVALPFAEDPGEKLLAKVNADHALGDKIGVNQTPTIFVVSNKEAVELVQFEQLNQIIEDVQKRAGPPPAVPKAPAAKKKKTG